MQLAIRLLADPNFILPGPLTWGAAKNWPDGCKKPVADHLWNADGSVIDKYDGLKEVCGKPHGDGYFWFCEKCLRKAGIIW